MTAEVSSQAYQVERVYGEHFDIGVFLNFSEDHISPKEHASMEEYLQCKLHLLENSSRAVICRETAQFDRVYDTARRCCRETLLVGMDRDDCDLTVRQVEKLEHGFRFAVQERGSQTLHHYHLAMDGDFNIENALAAIGVGRLLGAGQAKRLAMSPGSSKSGLSVVKKMRSAYLPHISPIPWIRWGERPPAMPVTTVMGAPG